MRSHPGRPTANVALALLSCVAAFALVELGLRAFWSDFHLKFRPDLPTGVRHFQTEDGEPCYYRFDRHWTAWGHRHAARLLREKLRSLGWLASGA